ncbi:hypothetical protein NL676_008042 [Syzygium grande]|nr:hypothetical protein NL676_008042 [Syzygium grande]
MRIPSSLGHRSTPSHLPASAVAVILKPDLHRALSSPSVNSQSLHCRRNRSLPPSLAAGAGFHRSAVSTNSAGASIDETISHFIFSSRRCRKSLALVAAQSRRNWKGKRPISCLELYGAHKDCIGEANVQDVAARPRLELDASELDLLCIAFLVQDPVSVDWSLPPQTRLYLLEPKRGVDVNDYFNIVASEEREIRDCYSKPLKLGKSKLVEMMVPDGCFLIEWQDAYQNISCYVTFLRCLMSKAEDAALLSNCHMMQDCYIGSSDAVAGFS